MPPELAEVQVWLRKAAEDRQMAEVGLAQSPPLTSSAAFHCQQAVEKCLKAFLVFREVRFERIHDLESLIDQCAGIDPDWDALRDSVEPLTGYAVRFRYPGPPDPTVKDVQTALEVAGNVYRFVLDRLPSEVRP